jgi:hypothetical protein
VANIADDSQPPREMANVAPLDLAGAGQTRLIVEAVKDSVADLKSDVKDIKNYRYSDLFKYLSAIGAAVVLLGGMMIAAYFRVEDQIQRLQHELRQNSTICFSVSRLWSRPRPAGNSPARVSSKGNCRTIDPSSDWTSKELRCSIIFMPRHQSAAQTGEQQHRGYCRPIRGAIL